MHFPLELKAQLPCQCTRKFTGNTPTIQRFCYCLTCGITPENNRSICEPCAYACHAGHLFCYGGTGPVVCSCGLKEDVNSKKSQNNKKSKGKKVAFNDDDEDPNICECFDQPAKEVLFDAEDEEEEEANEDADQPGKPPVELTPCLEIDDIPYSCTLSKTKDNFYLQHNYRCLTCNQKPGEAVCAVCARICHAGHQLQDNGITPFYCDCGSNAIKNFKCKCLFKNPTQSYQYRDAVTCLPFEIPLKCTSEFEKKADGSSREFIQRGFRCETCNTTEENPICEACAIKCHNGHKLVDLKMKQFICSCNSATCQCRNDTEEKYVPSICAEEGLNSYNCGCDFLDVENPDQDDDHHDCECHHHDCECHHHDHE